MLISVIFTQKSEYQFSTTEVDENVFITLTQTQSRRLRAEVFKSGGLDLSQHMKTIQDKWSMLFSQYMKGCPRTLL